MRRPTRRHLQISHIATITFAAAAAVHRAPLAQSRSLRQRRSTSPSTASAASVSDHIALACPVSWQHLIHQGLDQPPLTSRVCDGRTQLPAVCGGQENHQPEHCCHQRLRCVCLVGFDRHAYKYFPFPGMLTGCLCHTGGVKQASHLLKYDSTWAPSMPTSSARLSGLYKVVCWCCCCTPAWLTCTPPFSLPQGCQ